MITVIMAGGKGTRLASVARDIPKPMVTVNGMPVLEYEISMLREQGFKDIIITVGHLGDVIINYFGDGTKISPATGKPFGVNIDYYFEEQPLGNAGALLRIRDKLSDDFLLLNGDTVFNVDFQRMIKYHYEKKAKATLFVHPNSHPYDSGVLIEGKNGEVVQWLTKEDERPKYYHNTVNAGLHVLHVSLIDEIMKDYDFNENADKPKKVDLDRNILKPLCGTGKMYCYHSPEYVKDMGTPERLEAVCSDFQSGKVMRGTLKQKQKAIFLDRDGTINEYVGFLRKKEDFKIIEGVAEAINIFHDNGYLVIVVTNQPVIARGEVTLEYLDEIHMKMETLLGNEGAFIDALYFCPHHPDKGFPGEVPEYKMICDCRKPKPGMLLKAAQDFNIDMSKSWMVGDGRNDVNAGKNAGCRTAYIGTEDIGQDILVDNLLEFAKYINESEGNMK